MSHICFYQQKSENNIPEDHIIFTEKVLMYVIILHKILKYIKSV